MRLSKSRHTRRVAASFQIDPPPAHVYACAMDPVEREVYAAICAEPGLHPREYVQRVPSGYWEVTAAARRLLAAGSFDGPASATTGSSVGSRDG